MKKIILLTIFGVVLLAGTYYALAFIPAKRGNKLAPVAYSEPEVSKLKAFAAEAKSFTALNGYNTKFCFLLDMNLGSGQYRFFVYDLAHDSVLMAGLVAHGSCNKNFLMDAKFSNRPGCGCSAKGKYKVGYKYKGRFGTAYKLYGLDSTNNKAFERNIVLHSYYMVPDRETDPLPICNSLGCAMVSANFIKQLSVKLDASKKPVLLWMFE
ncbi:MAG TPA: murein L,D-transpeptidase catalytic domain family protein [Chitinophagaceae bacterium]|nr:murein L,D-transpeptidase catalytic domain family protein [Chitinophagaceae bacterium]